MNIDKDKVIFGGGVLLMCVVFALTGSLYFVFKSGTFGPGKVSVQTPTSVPATPAAIADYKTAKVQVLNASGVSGRAGKLADKIKSLGYTNVEAGNNETVIAGNKLMAPLDLASFKSDLSAAGFTDYTFEVSDDIKIIIGK